MGDEVTKKDLQNLQATFNAKLAALSKQLADIKTGARKDSDEVDGIVVTVRRNLDKRIDDLTNVVKALATKIDR